VLFRDRVDAGLHLAAALQPYRSEDPVVEGLPRGGVPVAFEVAEALQAPLDVLLVRKLGCPGQTELGLGAIGEGGVRLVNQELVERVGISAATLDEIAGREEAVLDQRLRRFRGERARVAVRDRTVIIIDDGLATGYTARAAIEVMRLLQARRVVLAVPVAPAATLQELSTVADELVCLYVPPAFMAIGAFYGNFTQVPDDDVARLLAGARPAPDQKTRPTAGSS
jgi:putative phosphoribosyl transferase